MDDMYPNNGSYFQPTEPEDQTAERIAEKGKVKEGIQMLEEVIARFDHRIAFYDSLNSIPDDIKLDPTKLAIAVYSKDQTIANLQIEKEYLEGLRETYK